MENFIVISGCSGGGKSTLLAELAQRGHATVEEPGRRIVRQETANGGSALPWQDPAAFARRAIDMAIEDRRKISGQHGWVFFDRSWIDAASFLEHTTGETVQSDLAARHPYRRTVFMAPPWPEIFTGDRERRHDFSEAVAEYERLLTAYPALGYDPIDLPRAPVADRASFILSFLDGTPA